MDTEKRTFVLVHGAWHGGWFRAYGNEQWEFDTNGLMRRREGSINDVPIRGSDRKFHWLAGRALRITAASPNSDSERKERT